MLEKTYAELIDQPDSYLLTTKEAAVVTRLSEAWFHRYASLGGGLPFIKAGNKRLYRLKDLKDWLAFRQVHNTAEAFVKFGKKRGESDERSQNVN